MLAKKNVKKKKKSRTKEEDAEVVCVVGVLVDDADGREQIKGFLALIHLSRSPLPRAERYRSVLPDKSSVSPRWGG